MRIGLLNTQVPFVTGGAELLANNLKAELIKAGHEADIISLPFNWYPAQTLVDHIVAGSLLDVTAFNNAPIDLAIGLKFPAYLARHPRKAYWLVHQHRQAYDMWDAGTSDLLHQDSGQAVKGAIEQADRVALGSARVFTISGNVTQRLERYCGVSSLPIYHPPPLAELLHPGDYGDYVLVPSRLGPAKRQDLVVEALARMRRPLNAVFVGKPDDPTYRDALKRRAAELGLDGRIRWLEGVPGRELAALYAGARAIVFVPVDEDYGYVTLEAMLAHKPVVTVTDAGGPLEFIEHGRNGLVSAPEPDAVARHLDMLAGDAALAAALGAGAIQRYRDMDIAWSTVIDHLLERPRAGAEAGSAARELPMVTLPEPVAGPEPVNADVSLDQTATRAVVAAADPAVAPEAVVEPQDDPVKTEVASKTADDGAVAAPIAEASPGVEQTSTESAIASDAAPAPSSPPEAIRVDVAVLREGLPVSSLAEVLGSFDMLANANPEMLAYLESHWVRYLQTLAMIPRHNGGRFLDLGTGEPYGFLALVKLVMPEARFTVVVEDKAQHGRKSVFPSLRGGPPLEVEVAAFNVEVDPFPFGPGRFDTVLAMEVLEHLSLNPAHLFAESARVLCPGGSLIVTTPNIVSYRAVSLALSGHAPYSFGVFVPFHGYYGRHNREYTPHEVDVLGRMAGFEPAALITKDVYDSYQVPYDAALMARSDYPLALRGQNTFYHGVRTAEPKRFGPTSLYRDDPIDHKAQLVARPGAAGGIDLSVINEGAVTLLAEGPERTVLTFDVYDCQGRLETYAIALDLPAPVRPGQTVTRTLPIAPHPGGAISLVRAALHLHGRGPLDLCGARPISIVAAADAALVLKALGQGGQTVAPQSAPSRSEDPSEGPSDPPAPAGLAAPKTAKPARKAKADTGTAARKAPAKPRKDKG
jgi:glycosyltransferase involved in cell wall biosynthesis/SAM-dependent methyltransferase